MAHPDYPDDRREMTQADLDADETAGPCDIKGCGHNAGYCCVACGAWTCREHAAPGEDRHEWCADCINQVTQGEIGAIRLI